MTASLMTVEIDDELQTLSVRSRRWDKLSAHTPLFFGARVMCTVFDSLHAAFLWILAAALSTTLRSYTQIIFGEHKCLALGFESVPVLRFIIMVISSFIFPFFPTCHYNLHLPLAWLWANPAVVYTTSLFCSSEYEKVHGLARHGHITPDSHYFLPQSLLYDWPVFLAFPSWRKINCSTGRSVSLTASAYDPPSDTETCQALPCFPHFSVSHIFPTWCYLYNKLAAEGFLGNIRAFLLSILQQAWIVPQ